MPDAHQIIASEIEAAIRAGSPEKHLETARKVTELFLASADSFNGEQIELFGAVLARLVKTIEIRALADLSARMALAEMSNQLAGVPQAPAAVVGILARNEQITIAGPVLTESSRLNDDDLVELAQTRSEQHLLAISARWWLKEVVTDALLSRRFPAVSRRLVNNPGARLSAGGFAILLSQAESDPDLAVETGIRLDMPADLRLRLLRSATEAVRAKLLSRAPPHLFEEIKNSIATASAAIDREMTKKRDFLSAQRLIAQLKKSGRLSEPILLEFAKQRRYEETVVCLADLARTTVEVIRPLMQNLRDDGLLIPCKVAGLSWETVSKILESRLANGAMAPSELDKAEARFEELTIEDARRQLKLQEARAGDAPPTLN